MKTYALVVMLFVSMTVSGFSAEEHAELRTLRKNYEKAVFDVTTPLLQRYIAELKVLRDEFAKSNQLEPALQVESEIERVRSESSTARVLSRIEKLIVSKRWSIDSGAKWFEFRADGTARAAESGDLSWNLVSPDRFVILSEERVASFTYDSESKTFKGRTFFAKPATLR